MIERSTITVVVQLSFLTFSLVHYCFIWKSPTTAVEITLFYNHNGKYLHLQGTQKFYILQIFLQCFLHSTTWFWPKSTSTISPKFYISTRFFSTFSTFYKSILGQFYILQNNRAPPLFNRIVVRRRNTLSLISDGWTRLLVRAMVRWSVRKIGEFLYRHHIC